MNDSLGIAVNLAIAASSQYVGYNFNSMCQVGDVFLGAGDDGIFKLDIGDDDDGFKIDARFDLATTDFGSHKLKRLRKLNIGYKADGQIKITVNADDYHQETVLTAGRGDLTQHGSSIKIDRHQPARYLSLSIENINGSDFSIDSIHAFLTILGYSQSEM